MSTSGVSNARQMYATDTEIRALLPQLDITAAYSDYPLRPDDQIQPCSVDLRLDTTFWIPRRLPSLILRPWARGAIDLRRSRLHEVSPRRYWRQISLKPGESFTLKPGRMVLCRVYEEFTVPSRFAGKVEGRSSYARLGLMIHCAADFINPGWRGHMPLELVNFNRNSIRIVPFMPICQLMLVKLSDEPARTYGDVRLSSKYVGDDGGPSYWWRDQLVSDLLADLGDRDLAVGVQEGILDELGEEPSLDVLVRLERFARELPVGEVDNAQSMLLRFSKKEASTKRNHTLARTTAKAAPGFILAAAIGANFEDVAGWVMVLFAVILVLSLAPSWYAWTIAEGEYLTEDRLRKGDPPA